ncbi:MAG TPA: SAM-dependent methyltransferase, partial [Thermoanaerobaculia bacterium]
MPLSDAERRTLTGTVGRCRRLLEDEAHNQLEVIYRFNRDGVPRALDGLPSSSIERGVAEELREWHRHFTNLARGTPAQRQLAALRRMAEETAFTVLHRLAAIRMAEERGVLRPCLRDGLRSDAFRLFLQFSEGALGREEEAYRLFLERVFDEIAQDLPALFDRREPRSLIFPRAKCLEDVVAELTVADLRRAWQDDEAIGWVYQDFDPAKERKELRRGNDVPRDSTDLAIRNQLFTPRWVVEFLTDNTLGRLWIEMTDGETEIADACAYLLRADVTSRVAPKDVRDIRVLDPACGSGHFLLYAFDLLERIYREAWDRRIGISPDRKPLWVECP